jgi:hypothetical protein
MMSILHNLSGEFAVAWLLLVAVQCAEIELTCQHLHETSLELGSAPGTRMCEPQCRMLDSTYLDCMNTAQRCLVMTNEDGNSSLSSSVPELDHFGILQTLGPPNKTTSTPLGIPWVMPLLLFRMYHRRTWQYEWIQIKETSSPA